MERTARHNLPMLQGGQAGKEIIVNEALTAIDLLLGGSVEEPPRNAPPASPVDGQSYIIGTAPTGGWAGQAGRIAAYTATGWRLLPASDGLTLLVKSTGTFATFRGGQWDVGDVRAAAIRIGGQQVVGTQRPAIAAPSGGGVVDAEARTAITSILVALRSHGLIAT